MFDDFDLTITCEEVYNEDLSVDFEEEFDND